MKKMFFALLGVGLVCGGYFYFNRAHLSSPPSGLNGRPIPAFAPKETIEGTRARVKQIEKDAQRQADDMLKKTE